MSNDSDFDGLLFVQGGDGGQNRILVDQVSVSDAYHFGGVVSVLNTDVIDRVEFLSGGYTAEYGDALSGVLKIQRRIGNLAKVRGTAGLSLLTANGTLEGPLGKDGKGSWLVAAPPVVHRPGAQGPRQRPGGAARVLGSRRAPLPARRRRTTCGSASCARATSCRRGSATRSRSRPAESSGLAWNRQSHAGARSTGSAPPGAGR